MPHYTRGRLSPAGLLRPRRAVRLARTALLFYLLSRPFRRSINPRREALRRRYARPRNRDVLGWLFSFRRVY